MTRLQRLIRTVEQEQAAFAANRTEENREMLHNCQDRLVRYTANSGKTAPFELFTEPPCQK
jgi:hypothetical protein